MGYGAFLFSQEDGFLQGTLKDEETREPIVLATIRVTGKALGVISNNDGSFQIPAEFQFKRERLEISSMGYQTKTIAFSDLKKGIVDPIYVKPALFKLSEAVVKGRKKGNLPPGRSLDMPSTVFQKTIQTILLG